VHISLLTGGYLSSLSSSELESYTLTFKLMLEEGTEKEIVATARTPEELKKVLEID